MKPIILAQTEDTPDVVFDTEKEQFIISGRSMPEDTSKFYLPLIEWILEYNKAPKAISNFVFQFEFISTSTSKQLMKVFYAIEQLSKTHKVNVSWNYEKGDLNMRRSGELLQKLVTFKLGYQEV